MRKTGLVLVGIERGDITTTFRTWKSPRVKVGTRLRTPIGIVEVTGLSRVGRHQITETDARAAGFDGLEALNEWFDDRPGEVYRLELRHDGPDPRVELRNRANLAEDDVTELRTRLAKMDGRAESPWTWATLRLIAGNPGRVSTELAAEMGLERRYFKNRVRRLKELGLTESLQIGYRISPRGEALLEAGAADGQ